MNRRSFLSGALVLSAAVISPRFGSWPVLHGDGIHDDTLALNALLAGERVIIDGYVVRFIAGETIELRTKSFLISSPLVVALDSITLIVDQIKLIREVPLLMFAASNCTVEVGLLDKLTIDTVINLES